MTATKTREILIGFGFAKQTDIATANTEAGIWSLKKLNTSMATPKLNTEDDAAELGKGNEFPTQVFKTSWDVAGQMEKYLSAEFAAWVMCFGLGNITPSGSDPNYIYTCKPLDPVTDGLELPNFSFVEQIRPGANSVIDHMAVGCAVEDWTLMVGSGPGRVNSKMVVNFVGSGKDTVPSGITLPAITVEKLLASASLACTINGVNYVNNKNIISLQASGKNNHKLDAGFFPGSGFQGADAEAQVDTITLSGSSGTASITLAGGLTKTVTFATDLATTAGNFVTANAAAYATQGITLTHDGGDLIFTASVPGTGFASPAIHNVTTNLTGSVVNTNANVVDAISGAIRGRLEVGDRVFELTFTARMDKDSAEDAKLLDQTEGTAVISLTYDSHNSLQLTYQRVVFSVVEKVDADGLVVVNVTTKLLWHVTNGLLTAVAKCNVGGIGAAES